MWSRLGPAQSPADPVPERACCKHKTMRRVLVPDRRRQASIALAGEVAAN